MMPEVISGVFITPLATCLREEVFLLFLPDPLLRARCNAAVLRVLRPPDSGVR